MIEVAVEIGTFDTVDGVEFLEEERFCVAKFCISWGFCKGLPEVLYL